MRTLGLVPARSGSRRIPRKNIRRLSGRPLLAYTAEAALAAERLAAVVLSTDDPAIAEVGRAWGLRVPFLRPADLARDGTPMLAVVRHALETLQSQGEDFEAICLLQPTHPVRYHGEIDGCVELLERSGADAVVTVLPVPPAFNPCGVYFSNGDGSLRPSVRGQDAIASSQDYPPAFYREGSVYVTRRRVVMEENSLYGHRLLGYLLDPEGRVNIDTPADWRRAARLVGTRL